MVFVMAVMVIEDVLGRSAIEEALRVRVSLLETEGAEDGN